MIGVSIALTIHCQILGRTAQMAVYEFMKIDRRIPPISTHDKSPVVQFEALVKAFK